MKAVWELWKLTDPEMDQARITRLKDQICAESALSEDGRPNWMKGSDSNDENQASENHLDSETEEKSRSVNAVIVI